MSGRFSAPDSMKAGATRRHEGGGMERDLVIRAQAGDVDAFSSLTAGRTGRLMAAARLILRRDDRAADAVQDALLQAWIDLRGLRDPDRFDAWLHRLLVRACYRASRRNRVREVAEIDVAGVTEPSVSDAQHDVAIRDQLDRGFRRLPPEHRTVLVLRLYLGLTQAETAEALDVPLGTVQSRLDRATRAMRAALDADDRQPTTREVLA
jgi:RNA polymerase sigma-70 factor, ECF subfamily